MIRATCLALVAALSLGTSWTHGQVLGFRVSTDTSIDTTSLESIVAQVIERSEAKTNDEKAIALYNWLHNTLFHANYPVEPRPQTVGPLKLINAYGWGLCGSQHTVLKALFETAGWKCRYVGWSKPAHTTIEVFYDGRWHYFDVFLKCYFWSKDRTHVVSQEEIAADPSIVFDAVREGRAAPQHLCCGDSEKDVVSGCKSRRVIGDVKGWGSCTWRDENYSPQLSLPCGASLRLDWKAAPEGYAWKPIVHSCGLKDLWHDPVLGPIAEHYGPRSYSSGVLTYIPDFGKTADLADITLTNAVAREGKLVARSNATALVKLPLPYPYVSGKVQLECEGGQAQLFVSCDAGATWKLVQPGDISAAIRQRYHVWLKTEFTGALSRFQFTATVQHNRAALPHLKHGKNKITVTCDNGTLREDQALVVTYVFQEAHASEKRMRFDGQGISYGPPKSVTKVITSVPYTFELEVAGNTPPKMLSLERAVRSRP